jgi:putative membrane protein insertion efficiency factor
MRSVLKMLIRIYQVAHYPFFRNVCRFYPSCSEYAIESLETHGVLKGAWLSVKRIVRCNPFFKGGFDPVPLKKEV